MPSRVLKPSEAVIRYGVQPRLTLRDRLSGRVDHDTNPGPKPSIILLINGGRIAHWTSNPFS